MLRYFLSASVIWEGGLFFIFLFFHKIIQSSQAVVVLVDKMESLFFFLAFQTTESKTTFCNFHPDFSSIGLSDMTRRNLERYEKKQGIFYKDVQ